MSITDQFEAAAETVSATTADVLSSAASSGEAALDAAASAASTVADAFGRRRGRVSLLTLVLVAGAAAFLWWRLRDRPDPTR